MRRNHKLTQTFLSSILMLFIGLLSLQAQAADIGTGISYQGRLDDTNAPASGNYDFQFRLFDAVTDGTQVGDTLFPTVTVSDGIFNTTLDFGAGAFNGHARFLEIGVLGSVGSPGYTILSPRQPITTVPHANSVKPIGNVVTVAKSGGDYNTITAALASITDNVSNPYLIRVGPGIYEESINLKTNVSIEGSGRGVTIIRGTGSATNPISDGTSATVRSSGAVVAEIRQLSMESIATSNYAIAIWTKDGGAALRIKNVDASASGGTSENFGVFNSTSSPTMTNVNTTATGVFSNYGVYNFSSSSPQMTHVIATGSGGTASYGVINYDSSNPTMKDVTASATGGRNNTGVRNDLGSTPTIRDSSLTGSTNSVTNDGTSSAKVSNSQIDGPVALGAGLRCIGSFIDDFVVLNRNCQPLYELGDTGPAGGIVFDITDGGLHGLEAAPVDSAFSPWGCWGTSISGAEGTAIGTGAQNTADIVAGCVSAEDTAAEVVDAYSLNGFADWFLPSKDELNQLYLQRTVVGGFAIAYYWSSSELDNVFAWGQYFYNGYQDGLIKYNSNRVRAVRAF